MADITNARDRATNHGRTSLTHGKVVAELSFGFWRYLTAQRYHVPGGDPGLRKRRRQVERHLADLMLVRNRAAHHEPIHRRNLTRDLAVAVELSRWIHPDAAASITAKSAIPDAMLTKPTSDPKLTEG
ncbi:MAG: hypothetical protein ACR2K3_05950 [Nocardioides sp.]